MKSISEVAIEGLVSSILASITHPETARALLEMMVQRVRDTEAR